MRFIKNRFILILLLALGCLLILVSNGSKNSPISKQGSYDEVPLTEDPNNVWQLPDFDISLPEVNIPILSGVLGLGGTGLFIIFIIILIMIILLISSLVISHRRRGRMKEKLEKKGEGDKFDQKEMKIRRKKLGERIEEIVRFLKSCLDEKYGEGITIGYERLDNALKEYSKISRPGWLTPREFSQLDIPYFNHEAMINAVEKFYRITYGQKEAHRKDLEDFINYLEKAIADKKVLEWYADVPIEKEDK